MIKQSEITQYWKLKKEAEETQAKFQALKGDLVERLHKQEEQEEGALALYFKPYTKTITRYKEVVEKMRAWLMGEGKVRSAKKLDQFEEEASRPVESQYLDIRQVEEVVVTKLVRVK